MLQPQTGVTPKQARYLTGALAGGQARLAELARAHDRLAALGGRAAAQDPADCRGYCSILAG